MSDPAHSRNKAPINIISKAKDPARTAVNSCPMKDVSTQYQNFTQVFEKE